MTRSQLAAINQAAKVEGDSAMELPPFPRARYAPVLLALRSSASRST